MAATLGLNPNASRNVDYLNACPHHPTQVLGSGVRLVAGVGQTILRNSTAADDNTVFIFVCEIQHANFLLDDPGMDSHTYNCTFRVPRVLRIAQQTRTGQAMQDICELCGAHFQAGDSRVTINYDNHRRPEDIRAETNRVDVRTDLEQDIWASAPSETPEADIRASVQQELALGYPYVIDLRHRTPTEDDADVIEYINGGARIPASSLRPGSIVAISCNVGIFRGVVDIITKQKCFRPRLILKGVYLLQDPAPLIRTNTAVRRITYSPPKRKRTGEEDPENPESPTKRANNRSQSAA